MLRKITSAGGLIVPSLILLTVIFWALFPDVVTQVSPYELDSARKFLPPGPDAWFGTDRLGRDLFSRVVHGSALSLAAAAIAVAVGFGIGTTLGIIAGYARGWPGAVIMRLMDVSLALPGILLSLLVITVLGFGVINVAIAVGIGSAAQFARLARAETLRVRSLAYIEAARMSGVGGIRLLGTYVLPNMILPVIALIAIQFGTAILAVSALSFLGYGTPPPEPEWGSLIDDGRDGLPLYWWLSMMPGLVIVLVVLASNSLSRRLSAPIRRSDAALEY